MSEASKETAVGDQEDSNSPELDLSKYKFKKSSFNLKPSELL
jgi:hypothetical protein